MLLMKDITPGWMLHCTSDSIIPNFCGIERNLSPTVYIHRDAQLCAPVYVFRKRLILVLHNTKGLGVHHGSSATPTF
jgi:hypothetical protein